MNVGEWAAIDRHVWLRAENAGSRYISSLDRFHSHNVDYVVRKLTT
jgi:hypothetical protein